jgi:hypothetical protein
MSPQCSSANFWGKISVNTACVAAVLLSVWVLGLAVSASADEGGRLHEFGTNGTAVLCVPTSDMDSTLLPYNDESTDLAVGSGHTPGFGFLFDAAEIQSHLEEGIFRVRPELNGLPHVNTLGGSVGFLSLPDSHRLGPAGRARDLADEWTARGRCAETSVEPFEKSDLFEMKCLASDNYSNLVDRKPDKTVDMPKPNTFVVATCIHEKISAGKFTGLSLEWCRREFVAGGFLFDYQIQKPNLRLYKQIDAFLVSKLSQWQKGCHSHREGK